jgi:hypothetical protein
VVKMPENSGVPAFVAQRIEHLTTDQKVGGSSPSKRTFCTNFPLFMVFHWKDYLSVSFAIKAL